MRAFHLSSAPGAGSATWQDQCLHVSGQPQLYVHTSFLLWRAGVCPQSSCLLCMQPATPVRQLGSQISLGKLKNKSNCSTFLLLKDAHVFLVKMPSVLLLVQLKNKDSLFLYLKGAQQQEMHQKATKMLKGYGFLNCKQ